MFCRDAIVHAALRAYVEHLLARVDPLKRHHYTSSSCAKWEGDIRRGAFYNEDGSGNYEVMAWNEVGVVGLACDLGCGPIELLGLEIDKVTGGPDDVRDAVSELPGELEPAFLMAVDMLEVGAHHGEKQAGVGFWLAGDRVGGSFFEFTDPTYAWGANRLAAWGKLEGDRLLVWWDRGHVASAAETAKTVAAPIHAIIDAVTTRALNGPTELTLNELATLLPTAPDPKRLIYSQRSLQKVGITWPGSPKIPD